MNTSEMERPPEARRFLEPFHCQQGQYRLYSSTTNEGNFETNLGALQYAAQLNSLFPIIVSDSDVVPIEP